MTNKKGTTIPVNDLMNFGRPELNITVILLFYLAGVTFIKFECKWLIKSFNICFLNYGAMSN